ncbi:ABC transporter ATP-binding protein [Shinella curvata]|uniref:ABC transporter ATP-binding protein n=1 Tax=Shinella curvata TaxID=1817964 RepID=A0ABT8XMB7_9HYPH|nr:ABC transporter ATP-binding protein [Shinella curvata]MCJ8056770.1 ABC transporter ATP-binding protein [Shinella curvata]MDO6124887.1 ABC transporter ATP-binding protein [Shinella curvata]
MMKPGILLDVSGLRIEGESGGQWQEIVKGVSFQLDRGEVLGLIGESGAGKSTIGLAALGYARPGCRFSGGQVRFEGRDLLHMPENELRRLRGMRIAYVAQSAAAFFNPAHRLIDQFIEVLAVHGFADHAAAAAKARNLYARLGLPDPAGFGQRYPHQVSGGQLQRAMIAMAMAGDPDLIVFDEPTTALDVTTQVGVLAAVRSAVRGSKTAALYITHDLAVVAQVADRIMVLRHGQTVEEAETQSLLHAPGQEYTRRLLASDPVIRPERAAECHLLEIDNLSASYGARRVLDAISIRVPKARTMAIVGESGSGKSTLARVITGLLAPDTGTLCLDGTVLAGGVDQRDRETLRRIQLIHQMPDTALNPRQKVSEILGRPLMFYKGIKSEAAAAQVAHLLEQVELSPALGDRFPGELSGGQKQRVCIARAISADPDLIICDEVTSGLDPLVAEGILDLLSTMQKQSGKTYLFITHDLKIVAAIADTVVVMKNGEVIEQNGRDAVLKNPLSSYTERLIESVPQMNSGWLDALIAREGADARNPEDRRFP